MAGNILIVGGSGFLGSHLAKKYLGQGRRVVVYDREEPGFPVEWCRGPLEPVVADASLVYNFAGVLGTDKLFDRVQEAIQENLNFAVTLMQLCLTAKVPLVSVGMAGDTWLNPYAITKRAMRDFAAMYYREGLVGCTIRPFVIYGPGQSMEQGKVIPTFIDCVYRGEPVVLYSGGYQELDMLYVEDFAGYVADELDPTCCCDGVEIGTGKLVAVRDILGVVERVVGRQAIVKEVPGRRGEGHGGYTKCMNHDAVGHFSAGSVSLEDGIERTFLWYLGQPFPVRCDDEPVAE